MKKISLKQFQRLQNGSDIRGVALEGIPGETVNLTPDVALALGRAFGSWLRQHEIPGSKVAVGNDSRISGARLKKAFIQGVADLGWDVLDCGLASTPAMFMATIEEGLEVAAGVMLTASHLPFNRNGFKFFTASGGFDKKGISELLSLASTYPEALKEKGSVEISDFMQRYAAYLVDFIRREVNDPDHYEQPLQGMKILVDAGNGAGGFFASWVLEALGADTAGSQFLQPDGRFPNHVPNPEDPEAMASISRAVLGKKADLGIIFDTDVDRSALVDAQGNPINRNELIALISSVILEEHPGSVIVTDSITSSGLADFIAKLGGVHHRFKRGYKNVINESIRLNEAGQESWLAIETSGHAALKENHFLDDGAFLVAKLLVEAARLHKKGQSLGDRIASLAKAAEDREFRLKINAEHFAAYGEHVLELLASKIQEMDGWSLEEPNFEGVRVHCRDEEGWFLLRISLHDPVMPLNVESKQAGGVKAIASQLLEFLGSFNQLDLQPLRSV